jgi:hypothetical protein
MIILIGWGVSEPSVRERREDRSATRCEIVPGTFSFPQRASFSEGPSLHSHVSISRPQSAGEVGLLHVVIGPKILWGFLLHNLSDSVVKRYFPHQECSSR